ncbi:pitrilysin family protein [Oceanicaulis sp. MMSF_3324]|uniref:M16 family metallopeptidase n=1 Tax=Oceanicaulis sp. MMSF_3324 TaxID=3046702 RepID=UPI00273DF216|nr:insulinase family protein [Oceanicaulis sp. MMSF_3324]
MAKLNSRIALWCLTPIAVMSLWACSDRGETGKDAGDSDLAAAFESADFPHEASDIAADPAVRYGVLDNGLRYAILENDTPSGTAALRMVFDVGSLAEEDDQRGLAHFIEHMAFNGTTHVPEGEMVALLERYGLAFGADTNAFTGREVVGYQLDLPSNSEEMLNVGLFLMRETASEVIFDSDAIDRERGVILGEERFRNTPIRRFFNAYYTFLYPDTIITERDAIGTVDVIENAPAERLKAYYDDYYTPERGMLVVVGDVDADQIEAKIRDGFDISLEGLEVDRVSSFASWEQPNPAAPDPEIGTVDDPQEPQFGFFYDPDVFTLITVDVIEPGQAAYDTQEARFEDLLRQLGNGIVQRRLQSEINRGASPLVQASLSYGNEFDLVNKAGLFAVSSPDRWREGVAALEQELRRAQEYGFTQAELNEQLANVRTSLRNAVDQADTRQSGDLADSVWSSWIEGQVFSSPSDVMARFEALEDEITLEAVEDAFNRIWKASPPKVMVALNQDITDGEAAVREAWLASSAEPVEAVEEAGVTEFAYTDFGAAGEVVSTNRIEDLGVDQIVFDNGVMLNVKTTDFEDNVIRVRVDFGAGDLTPQPTAAAGTILGAAFGGGGLEAHDRDELQRLLAGRSVGYGLNVGPDSFAFANATTPTDFELQMQVLAAFMTAPGWREDGLNQFRAIAEEIRRGQNAQAVQVAVNRVGRMLRSGDPRWGFPTSEEVNAFTMDHARTMLEPALERAPIEITIAGDVTTERAIEVVASTFGALADRDESWPSYEENADIRFPDPTEEPVVVTFNGQDYQGMANVYYPTTDGINARERRAYDLLRAVYNLKAIDRFREQEGATYSAIVSSQQSRVSEGFGFFWVGLDVAVDEIDRMYDIADEIALAMANGDISEDELQRARNPILESLEENFERNPFWVNALSGTQSEPEDLDQIRSVEADYRDVTVEELVALASRSLRPDEAYRVTILPQSAVQGDE